MKQDCNHDIVTKYGVAECQNYGIEESQILKQNKMEKTAVEWFFNELQRMNYFIGNDMVEAYKQAKEMEKQQKIYFARHCLNKAKDLDILSSFMNVEQYYNETFKNK